MSLPNISNSAHSWNKYNVAELVIGSLGVASVVASIALGVLFSINFLAMGLFAGGFVSSGMVYEVYRLEKFAKQDDLDQVSAEIQENNLSQPLAAENPFTLPSLEQLRQAIDIFIPRLQKRGINITEKIAERLLISNSQKNRNAIQPISESECRVSPEAFVTEGQGEYIVFYPELEKTLTKEVFERAYAVLNNNTPASIVNRSPEFFASKAASRYKTILREIQEIDSSLRVVFIPRTLYELVLIRKIIQEDLNARTSCTNSRRPSKESRDEFKKNPNGRKNPNEGCWHIHLINSGEAIQNTDEEVIDISYRLNQEFFNDYLKKSPPTQISGMAVAFQYRELESMTQKEIAFLKSYAQKTNGEKETETNEVSSIEDAAITELIKQAKQGEPPEGPLREFGSQNSKIGFPRTSHPMTVNEKWKERLIIEAVQVDCSLEARRSFLLFRGAVFNNDSLYDARLPTNQSSVPFSLSFGSGLFAGSMYDQGATAFAYMMGGRDCLVVAVPYTALHTSPLFIPEANTIAQLFSQGEIFHARTKYWNSLKVSDWDFRLLTNRKLKSELSEEDLNIQYLFYKYRRTLLLSK